MKRIIRAELCDSTKLEDVEALRKLLDGISINCEISNRDIELQSGAKIPKNILSISWDDEQVKFVLSRNAGAPRKYLMKPVSISEIRNRIGRSSADQVAKELGISKSTLYRKIKRAEESGYDSFL